MIRPPTAYCVPRFKADLRVLWITVVFYWGSFDNPFDPRRGELPDDGLRGLTSCRGRTVQHAKRVRGKDEAGSDGCA